MIDCAALLHQKPVRVAGLRRGAQEPSTPDLMDKRETLEMVRVYYLIRDPKVRDALRLMAKAMTKGAGSP